MRRLRWLYLLLVTSFSALSFAGDVQISCEPALRVYLDGKLVGTSSSKEDGLFLASVPEGAHVIRVEKDGFVPQSFQVEVRELPTEVKVEAFSAVPPSRSTSEAAAAEAKAPTGDLVVTSAPQNCVVEIDGKAETKDTPLLRIEGLAAGEHPISFSKTGYDRLSGVVRIQPGAEVTVRGDLKAGKLETRQEGKGSLRVYSTPEHCTVRILGMTKEKTRAVLNLSYLPAGEHRMVVSWKGREQSANVLITDRHRTIVTVSFMKGAEPFVVSYEPQ
jgi:hypothetical protein